MKKIMTITAMFALIGLSLQAGPKVEMKTSGPSGQGDLIWWAPSSGITNLRMTTNGLTYITLYETPVIYDLTLLGDLSVTSNITVGVKSTLNGELEVNNSDVDINMTLSANEIDITQTNTTGQSGVASITITDARTGSTANDTNEATLKLSAAGTYALAINNGALYVDDGVTINGTLGVTDVATFTAESVHNGGIDADYVTVDAAAGITVKSAGSLAIGTNTATSVNYGGASVTAHTFVTDGTGTGEIVLPNESIGNAELASGIDAAKLLAASSIPAVNLVAGTNLPITITPQAPSAHTPTITVTKQTGAVTASGANNLVTPTATITPQTVTAACALTPQTGSFGISLTLQTYQLTNDTALVVTNVVLNVASAWTNATAAITPDLMTNATCAITPDLASNSVVAVSVTGGGAVMTNATAASSALPVFATNAIATNP